QFAGTPATNWGFAYEEIGSSCWPCCRGICVGLRACGVCRRSACNRQCLPRHLLERLARRFTRRARYCGSLRAAAGNGADHREERERCVLHLFLRRSEHHGARLPVPEATGPGDFDGRTLPDDDGLSAAEQGQLTEPDTHKTKRGALSPPFFYLLGISAPRNEA